MEEQKIREYIELARLFGYRLTVGEGWLAGALDTRCCCPMGAVCIVQVYGRTAWYPKAIEDSRIDSTGARVRTAARALRCSEDEVRAFVDGYDAHPGTREGLQRPVAWDLGMKFRREVTTPPDPSRQDHERWLAEQHRRARREERRAQGRAQE